MGGRCMKIGYAMGHKTLTKKHKEELTKDGCELVFIDKPGGKIQWEKMKMKIKKGDTLILSGLSFMKPEQLKKELQDLLDKDIRVEVLNFPAFNKNEDNINLIFDVISFVEKEKMNRIIETKGVPAKKQKKLAEKARRGRKTLYTKDNESLEVAIDLYYKNTPISKISRITNISRPTLYAKFYELGVMERKV